MCGHVIDGRNLLPATGYLVLVWQTIGMMKGLMYSTVPIMFQDVDFIRATHLTKNDAINLMITIQKGIYEYCRKNALIIIVYFKMLQMGSLK